MALGLRVGTAPHAASDRAKKEETMKKRSIIVSVAVASVLGLWVALPAHAGDKKQVDMITCEDFVKMSPAAQERAAYWVDGYQHGGKSAIEIIEFDKFGQPVGEIVEDCKKTPKETLWQKLKNRL
jgi:hypothetical protein